MDIADPASVDNLAVETEKAFGRLDILVNNAGTVEKFLPIAESDPEAWWHTWVVNVRGPYLVTRAFLPLLINSEGGSKIIVNVSSSGAHTKRYGASSYQARAQFLLSITAASKCSMWYTDWKTCFAPVH